MELFDVALQLMLTTRTKRFVIYGRNLQNKLRYGGIWRILLDALSKAGINIFLYYHMLERLDHDHQVYIKKSFTDYKFGFLKKDDMPEIAAIPIRNSYESESELRQRLEMGMKCFGAKHRGQLVSYAWCRLDYGELLGEFFPLEQDEAYMFDSFTVMEYRGKGLATYARYQLSQALRTEGRNKLHSFTNVFNTSAIRFTIKLNAQIIEKGLLIILFGKLRFHRIIKTYCA